MTLPTAVLDQQLSHKDCFLVLSAHDYRSSRKAGIHFIAAELAKRGPTRFFSLRYSLLSRYKADPRLSLDSQANKIASHEGVDCYLWKTLIHPFNTRRAQLRPVEDTLYRWYNRGDNAVLRQWIREATVIVVESGIATIFVDLVKQLNPRAKLIYRASDSLEAINVAGYVHRAFARAAEKFHTIVLPSTALAETIPSKHNLVFVPQGIDHNLANYADPNPYTTGIHGVSVGSMLFDPGFFIHAAKRFPHIQFHVIGSGQPRHPDYSDNVNVYGEMPFAQTLRYIKHANFGIAPYNSENLPAYLRDTSLKLTQYEFFKIPAVCPDFIAGHYCSRMGYRIGDADSIEAAIKRALNPDNPPTSRRIYNWAEVTDRMLAPHYYPDTELIL